MSDRTVTIDTTKVYGTASHSSWGLSWEKDQINGILAVAPPALVSMFRLLGTSSVLRIGGNSVNAVIWTPGGSGHQKGQVAPSDITATAAFAKATGWSIIYGVRLKGNTVSAIVDEAQHAASALGSSLLGIELGNEPDLSGESYSAWLPEFTAAASALRSAIPGVKIVGPEVGSPNDWMTNFANAAPSSFDILTAHYYRGGGQTGTVDQLAKIDGNLSWMSSMLHNSSGGKPWRFDEFNTFWSGGAPGVSNAFISALWAIDVIFTVFHNGGALNFHGDLNGLYAPIQTTATAVIGAAPEFYGILLAAQAMNGKVIGASSSVSDPYFASYAALDPNGATNVVLNNKNSFDTNVTVDMKRTTWGASGLFLKAASLTATDNVTFGGSPVNADGTWQAKPATNFPIVGGSTFIVPVPAGSAVFARVY